MVPPTRRDLLGSAGLAAALALAGCTDGGGGDGTPTETQTATPTATTTSTPTDAPTGTGGAGAVTGDDYPAIDRWLTETDVGAADDSYDGTFVDRRGDDTVTIDVGAEGNGDFFAFAPVAVVVSTGTEIRWRWTGKGGAHNVEALPFEQIGESDYEFSSGEPVDATGVQHTRTLEDVGIVNYHCEPHLALGMKGGIAVE
ncbi:halocyanin domain-containing protein [Halorarius halobius]|uniref:halocyanin domain-containing protein n=1 Tax=Halorarius halobius TaxID=2962671 RepID=UPI0020CBB334|nr:halocyanin domain-containing protein [Halorarius halobius]